MHGALQLFWFPLWTAMVFISRAMGLVGLPRVFPVFLLGGPRGALGPPGAPGGVFPGPSRQVCTENAPDDVVRRCASRSLGAHQPVSLDFPPRGARPPRPARRLGSPEPATSRSTETRAGLSSTRLWKQEHRCVCEDVRMNEMLPRCSANISSRRHVPSTSDLKHALDRDPCPRTFRPSNLNTLLRRCIKMKCWGFQRLQ